MNEPGLVVLSETLADYAVVAAAAGMRARHALQPPWYPVLAPGGLPEALRAPLLHRGAALCALSALVSGDGPAARSQALLRLLPSAGDAGAGLAGASPALLLQALVHALAEGRPLVLGGCATADRSEPLRLEGDPQRLVAARIGSAAALPAAVYAQATGKTFIGLPGLDRATELLDPLRPAAVILADDLDRFSKNFLARLLTWSQEGPAAPVLLGILAGQSCAQLSGVVCRLLLHAAFRRGGGRLFEPPDAQPIPVRAMQPMEFYVAAAHGNEMHLRHAEDEVLCGASASRAGAVTGFDCEPGCPHNRRVRASEVPAHAVVLLSCDAFTLAGGLAPPAFNVLLNFLNGWTGAVLAPFKHVQGNPGLRLLANALIHSGASLGAVAQRLNTVSRFDGRPDFSYLVLGDPELVASSAAPPPRGAVVAAASADGIAFACEAGGAHAVEVTLPGDAVRALLAQAGTRPALQPLCESLRRPDLCFALRWLPHATALNVIVFGNGPLPDGPLVLRLVPTRGLAPQQRRAALKQVRRLRALASLDFLAPAARTFESRALSTLRAAAAYPRAVELMQGDAIVCGLPAILADEFRSARHDLVQAIRDEMATKRLWISQIYAAALPVVRRLAAAEPAAGCAICGGGVTRWSYEDGCGELPARRLGICERCGIVADAPAAAELELALAPCNVLTGPAHRQVFAIRNRSRRVLEVSLLHQFNQWRQLGIEADPAISDWTLQPGQQAVGEAVFRFPTDLGDDILQMQLFGLTDRFDLCFAGQKVKSMLREGGSRSAAEATACAVSGAIA